MGRTGPGKASAPVPSAIPLDAPERPAQGLQGGRFERPPPEEASVALGTGMLDFPAIVREAKRIGVKRYYIEDEAPETVSNIPVSLKYSRSLGF